LAQVARRKGCFSDPAPRALIRGLKQGWPAMSDNSVTLHLYDVSRDSAIEGVNEVLLAVGTGAFHGGVEVYGVEYSYGYTPSGTGVFEGVPRGCLAHRYRGSLDMGKTGLSQAQVHQLIVQLQQEWPGQDYDLLRRNCVQFSREMVQRLGCGPVPDWVTNLAGAGATLQDGFTNVVSKAQAAAIIAAAKAGEIDSKYDVRGQAQARVRDFAGTVNTLSRQYHVKAVAMDAATQLVDMANTAGLKAEQLAYQAAAKAGQLDEQYRIAETAQTVASRMVTKAGELDNQYRIREGAADLASKAGTKAIELDQQYAIRQTTAQWASKAWQSVSQAAFEVGQPESRYQASPPQGLPHAPPADPRERCHALEAKEPSGVPQQQACSECTIC